MSSPISSTSETDRLDPPSDLVALSDGRKVEIQRLKLRQLFRLLRIITRGGAGYLPMLREALAGATSDEDRAEAFGTQLIAIALIALPEAEDEAVEFIMSVVEPEGILPGRDKLSVKRNDELRQKLAEYLYNPEPEDAITIIEAVVDREKSDLVSLGKRLMASFKMAEKTGQLSDSKTSESATQIRPSSAVTPEPSTSSPLSTDGTTSESSTSESVG